MDAQTATYQRWKKALLRWGWRIGGVALLHFATLMALPLTLVALGSRFAALPIFAGFALEVLRSALRRGLRKEVRVSFLGEAALNTLDKRTPVPEAAVDSAFWAARLNESAITVNIPALLAATLAGTCILGLSWAAISGRAVVSLIVILLSSLAAGFWSNRRRASGFDAVVRQRARSAAWIAAAERDCGEIYGGRARGPFLARLAQSVQAWSSAEDQLERRHLQHRILLGALACVGVFILLRAQNIDPLHWESARVVSVHSISSVLLLSTGIPVAYVFVVHADSLLTAYEALNRLQPGRAPTPSDPHILVSRPSRLSARALSFGYPSSAQPVLANVDFEIELDRITLIEAPNGAGKTTLARLICGVLWADSGDLEIDGVACSRISRDDFGFVPQNPLIVETLSIEDNVRLVAPDATSRAISLLLLDLGLSRPLSQVAGELSRGEQRRIAIARAILKEPRVLLLDEPDVWLDDAGRAALARVLTRELRRRAVVVVSHRREWLPGDTNVLDLSNARVVVKAGLAPQRAPNANA